MCLSAAVPVFALVVAAWRPSPLVFQHGVGNELLGFPRVDTIESWVPLFLFAVLFGLSMDYHVFLLSRIRERYRETGDNRDAIVHGVGATGRIITGAALIIIAVFSGFARGDLVMFQQMGFGVAVALLLDATVVRLVLVPAAIESCPRSVSRARLRRRPGGRTWARASAARLTAFGEPQRIRDDANPRRRLADPARRPAPAGRLRGGHARLRDGPRRPGLRQHRALRRGG